MNLPDLSIGKLTSSYASGAFTPSDIINAIYDVLEAAPLAPVWISILPRDQVIEGIKHLARDQHMPLFGIPFAVKDNMDVAGLPTTAGCPAYSYRPPEDAFVIARLQAAGAILIGKTNLDQFATGLVGTRSPYGICSCIFNDQYISGGSSSGSAVAVAKGLVSFSLGTDTAGSGRVPAAFNNLVGFKPSRGLLSTSGVVPACRSLDCVSVFAQSSGDAKQVFEVAQGADKTDPFSRTLASPNSKPLHNARVGILQQAQAEFFGNAEYARLYAAAIANLSASGCSTVKIDFTSFRAAAELLYAGPYVAERFAAVGAFVKEHPDQVNETVRSIVLDAERWTAVDAYNALYRLEALKKETEATWQEIDVLMLPTTPTIFEIAEVEKDPVQLNARLGYYTNFVNLLDLCAVALPAGFTKDGLPFGVTYISKAFSDDALLKFCHDLEQERVLLGVIGAHLSGQPLNGQLVERGARLIRTTRTAADYRCFALTNTSPQKPGLLRTPGQSGNGIEIEIWSIHESRFGSFVAAVPPPLAIGSCELIDGSWVKGFVCEEYATHGMPDITHLGGWRGYLASKTM